MMVETPHIDPRMSPRVSPLVPGWAPVVRPAPEGFGLAAFAPAAQNSPSPQVFAKELLMIPAKTAIPGTQALALKCDIFASIDWTNDGVIIRSELLDEEGYGRTYDEAWSDLLTSLRDRHASLAKREARLSPADRRILNSLRDAINFDL